MITGEHGEADTEDGPEEKPDNVAQAAAQNRESLEQESKRSRERHRGKRDNQARCKQGDGIEMRVLGSEELHGHGGEGENDNHGGEDPEVAEKLAERVGDFGKGRGGEDLTDACLAVAVDGVLDNVKADERDETRGDEGHEGADPGRGVDAAIVAETESNSASGGAIA